MSDTTSDLDADVAGEVNLRVLVDSLAATMKATLDAQEARYNFEILFLKRVKQMYTAQEDLEQLSSDLADANLRSLFSVLY